MDDTTPRDPLTEKEKKVFLSIGITRKKAEKLADDFGNLIDSSGSLWSKTKFTKKLRVKWLSKKHGKIERKDKENMMHLIKLELNKPWKTIENLVHPNDKQVAREAQNDILKTHKALLEINDRKERLNPQNGEGEVKKIVSTQKSVENSTQETANPKKLTEPQNIKRVKSKGHQNAEVAKETKNLKRGKRR
jgi:hypothetical protein